jgi:hypothetical protein
MNIHEKHRNLIVILTLGLLLGFLTATMDLLVLNSELSPIQPTWNDLFKNMSWKIFTIYGLLGLSFGYITSFIIKILQNVHNRK